MEKKIEFSISKNGDIKIEVDFSTPKIISSDKREISAKDIFDILNYKIGDTYKLKEINLENDVLSELHELFKDIIDEINAIDKQ